MKRKQLLLSIVLFGMLSLSACTGNPKRAVNESVTSGTTVESGGYDSPERAVAAYIDGLKADNLDQMLGTFVIEHYVENYDLQAYLEHMGIFQSLQAPWPAVNDITKDLNIEKRKTNVVNSIRYQYSALCDAASTLSSSEPQVLRSEAEKKEFLEQLTKQLSSVDFSTVELNGFITPEQLNDFYNSESNQKNLSMLAEIYGADQITGRVAVVNFNGKYYALCFDTIEYDGKWYNLELAGNLSAVLGIETAAAGTLFLNVDDMKLEELKKMIVPLE